MRDLTNRNTEAAYLFFSLPIHSSWSRIISMCIIRFNVPKLPYSAHRVYLCALCVSYNKCWLFPYTALTSLCSDPFATMRNATISFVMSVLCRSLHLSVCPHVTTRLPLEAYKWNLIFEYFRKSVEEFQVSLKYDKNTIFRFIIPVVFYANEGG